MKEQITTIKFHLVVLHFGSRDGWGGGAGRRMWAADPEQMKVGSHIKKIVSKVEMNVAEIDCKCSFCVKEKKCIPLPKCGMNVCRDCMVDPYIKSSVQEELSDMCMLFNYSRN